MIGFDVIRASAISFKPTKWDKAGNADSMEALFVEAAKASPQVIVISEGALEGYVVADVFEGRVPAAELLSIAEPIDGPYVRRFQELARRLNTCLCFGFAELVGSEVYNSALFLDDNGDIRGRYHKVQLAEGTHPSWNYNRVGNEIRAFETPFGRAGIVICNDRWNPLIARTLVLDGARVIFIPSHGTRTKAQNDTVLARARENGVPIVEANRGLNLIVSQGEIVAFKWGIDRITTAEIAIPHAPSTRGAREAEAEYLRQQGPEMSRRYAKTQASV